MKYGSHRLSTAFLERHSQIQHAWATRELALMQLKGKGIPQDHGKGKATLITAARTSDRKAGWLLAVYYHNGHYGFPVDEVKSRFWREKTEKHLRSDASLIYDNHDYRTRSVQRYLRWGEVRDWLMSTSRSNEDRMISEHDALSIAAKHVGVDSSSGFSIYD